MATSKQQTQIDIIEVERSEVTFHIVGASPFVFNAVSQKAKHELLFPAGKKSAADRAATLKHDPLTEYRNSVYTARDGETALCFPSAGFKRAMASAAIDIPGAARSQIGRLVYVEGTMVGIYGVPQIFSTVVRSADMNRTPDIRTRAILPEWAATIQVNHAVPMMRSQMVARLLAAAGILIGVGDYRTEKGAGNFGSFRIVAADDPDFQRIVATGGRQAQLDALESPATFDNETDVLLSWFDTELTARKLRGVA